MRSTRRRLPHRGSGTRPPVVEIGRERHEHHEVREGRRLDHRRAECREIGREWGPDLHRAPRVRRRRSAIDRRARPRPVRKRGAGRVRARRSVAPPRPSAPGEACRSPGDARGSVPRPAPTMRARSSTSASSFRPIGPAKTTLIEFGDPADGPRRTRRRWYGRSRSNDLEVETHERRTFLAATGAAAAAGRGRARPAGSIDADPPPGFRRAWISSGSGSELVPRHRGRRPLDVWPSNGELVRIVNWPPATAGGSGGYSHNCRRSSSIRGSRPGRGARRHDRRLHRRRDGGRPRGPGGGRHVHGVAGLSRVPGVRRHLGPCPATSPSAASSRSTGRTGILASGESAVEGRTWGR